MKKLVIVIITLLLLIALTLGFYTFTKSRQLSQSQTLTYQGFLKTKIGNDYQLETDSGLITLIEGKAKPINFMKQNIKVEGAMVGQKLSVNKITPVK